MTDPDKISFACRAYLAEARARNEETDPGLLVEFLFSFWFSVFALCLSLSLLSRSSPEEKKIDGARRGLFFFFFFLGGGGWGAGFFCFLLKNKKKKKKKKTVRLPQPLQRARHAGLYRAEGPGRAGQGRGPGSQGRGGRRQGGGEGGEEGHGGGEEEAEDGRRVKERVSLSIFPSLSFGLSRAHALLSAFD